MQLRSFVFLLLPALALAQHGGPTPVSTKKVIRLAVAPSLTLPGTALAWRKVQVAAPEEGLVVERVRGYYSVAVKQGEVLVRLRDQAAKARYQAAQARTQAARARYEELLAGERPETVAEIRAELRRSQAAAKEAKKSLARTRDLLRRNAATPSQLDQEIRAAEVARQEAEAAKSRLDRILAGTRKEILRRQEAEWQGALAEEELAHLSLEDHLIRAPFSGLIDQVHVEVGAWVKKGGPVLDLVDASKLDVVALVPEDRIHQVPLGTQTSCDFPSVEGAITLTGTVASLGPRADLQGRTVPVLVRIENPTGRIRAGMSARVKIPLETPRERILVPKDAVLRSSHGPPRVVLVVDGKAQPREVELGISWGPWLEVVKGLKLGDVTVVRGNERLRPGQEVSPE
jgi:multidrug efflux pump subunit AcrA (membrane-fusion protein)